MAKQNIRKEERIGESNYNNQGCLMKIIEYNTNKDIIVEFQDEYKAKIRTKYQHFINGCIKNPYYKSVCNIGMIGEKYPSKVNNKSTKEYKVWQDMLRRCTDIKLKEKEPTYKDVTCCDEWLLFDNFYEWIHNQPNFDKWYVNDGWHLDKDILVKNNKIYSPETCCLTPRSVNLLFTKCNANRGVLPLGVVKHYKNFQSYCHNPFIKKQEFLGTYNTPEQAFQVYKNTKEDYIKQVAQEEYDKGNITKQCYEAMMDYKVKITD